MEQKDEDRNSQKPYESDFGTQMAELGEAEFVGKTLRAKVADKSIAIEAASESCELEKEEEGR